MMAAIALFLALILAVSATHKLMARDDMAMVVARLAHVPAAMASPLLLAAAALEILAAMALVFLPLRPIGAILAASIWAAYGVSLWRQRGQSLDCGCDFTRRAKPVDAGVIVRPFLLAAMALSVALTTPAPFMLETPFAALALLALWFAASELAALPRLKRKRI